jgi:hypothetical protein
VAILSSQTMDYAQMAKLQAACRETQDLAGGGTLQVQSVQVSGAEVLCDSSTGVLRPLMPAEMWRTVFHAIHDLAHE